ncbi:MAG TPA: hypothetical protein VHZ50_00340, partial [Puia sp.]|nr:hypothetical protein [Puia sp.]
ADVDDPGLSRFTSYGYNNATEYINGSAYINPCSVFSGNDLAAVQKILTNSSFDTLSISWGITTNDSSKPFNPDYRAISFLMPISKIFTENDFLAFNGRRFASDTITVTMELFNNTSFKILSGTANIYFVKVNIDNSGAEKRFAFSGLCNGNIGDSILITKGRFDFDVPATNFNF